MKYSFHNDIVSTIYMLNVEVVLLAIRLSKELFYNRKENLPLV